MSAKTVFLSWQSDTPATIGRNFVESALQKAVDRISEELEFDERPEERLEVDRDTKNAPGSPRIFDTIRRKIERAAVFVSDLTFVCKRRNGDCCDQRTVTTVCPAVKSSMERHGESVSLPLPRRRLTPSPNDRYRTPQSL
jgi:hypothetical protein